MVDAASMARVCDCAVQLLRAVPLEQLHNAWCCSMQQTELCRLAASSMHGEAIQLLDASGCW
jgi:hypothetical protein